MSPSVLQFTCTHCNTALTVPVSMAGVEGPCPKCGQHIQAPKAESAPASAPASFVAEPRERPKTSHPAKIPEPRSQPRSKEELADRESITPAPRGLPERSTKRTVEPRRSTLDAARTPSESSARSSRSKTASQPQQAGPFSRIGVHLLFAVASAATVYFLLYHFMPGGPGQTNREVQGPPPAAGGPVTPPTISPPPNAGERPTVSTDTSPPTSARPDTGADGAQAGAPEAKPVGEGDISEAEDLLRSFFGRRTLQERLGMAEPALPAESLQGGVLDGELPPTGELLCGSPKRNLMEDYVDFPFIIDFPVPASDNGEMRPTTIVVRKRGDNDPKVLIPPLIDLAGGDLNEFVKEPVEGQRTFWAVIEAMPRCFELGIPHSDKKFTYKISASNRQSEIGRAYASKQSPLAEQLYSPDSGIGWGRRIQAVIVLEWNTTEDPEQPYIEMREIKALEWNS